MQCVRICTRKLAPCDKRRSGGQGVEEESDTVADLRHEVREEIETVRLAIRNLMQLTKQVPWHTCARDLRRSRLRITFVAPSRPSAQKQHLGRGGLAESAALQGTTMDAAGVAHFGQLMHDSQLLNEYLAPPGLSPSSVLTSERPTPA